MLCYSEVLSKREGKGLCHVEPYAGKLACVILRGRMSIESFHPNIIYLVLNMKFAFLARPIWIRANSKDSFEVTILAFPFLNQNNILN